MQSTNRTSGNVSSYVQTQADNTSRRSGIVVLPDTSLNSFSESSDVSRRGYYKDLFMDSGISLTSRKELHAAPYIGFSMELFSSSAAKGVAPTDEDIALQKKIIRGSYEDENGVLLYPDGGPRFRCVYMNGGSASSHGESLEEESRALWTESGLTVILRTPQLGICSIIISRFR